MKYPSINRYHRIYLIDRDSNGNKVVRIKFRKGSGNRGFSIQTNGNLPSWHTQDVGEWFSARSGCNPMTAAMSDELIAYLRDYGTQNQKKHFYFLGQEGDK